MSHASFESVLHAVRVARSDYALNRDALTSKIDNAEAWINNVSANRSREVEEAISYGEVFRSPTSGKLYIRLSGIDRRYQRRNATEA